MDLPETENGKLVVHYSRLVYAKVGHRACLYPIDHTSSWVSNTCEAVTSEVLSYDQNSGRIETLNSVYYPM